MMGYTTPAPKPQQDGSPALVKWSLGQSLQHIRQQVRRMIKALCPPSQHRCLTGKAEGQPLLHLGITTHLVTLPISIPLTSDAEAELTTRIIQSQTSSSYKAATQKLQQKQWVIQHRLRTKGRTKWLDSLKMARQPFPARYHTNRNRTTPTRQWTNSRQHYHRHHNNHTNTGQTPWHHTAILSHM